MTGFNSVPFQSQQSSYNGGGGGGGSIQRGKGGGKYPDWMFYGYPEPKQNPEWLKEWKKKNKTTKSWHANQSDPNGYYQRLMAEHRKHRQPMKKKKTVPLTNRINKPQKSHKNPWLNRIRNVGRRVVNEAVGTGAALGGAYLNHWLTGGPPVTMRDAREAAGNAGVYVVNRALRGKPLKGAVRDGMNRAAAMQMRKINARRPRGSANLNDRVGQMELYLARNRARRLRGSKYNTRTRMRNVRGYHGSRYGRGIKKRRKGKKKKRRKGKKKKKKQRGKKGRKGKKKGKGKKKKGKKKGKRRKGGLMNLFAGLKKM